MPVWKLYLHHVVRMGTTKTAIIPDSRAFMYSKMVTIIASLVVRAFRLDYHFTYLEWYVNKWNKI